MLNMTRDPKVTPIRENPIANGNHDTFSHATRHDLQLPRRLFHFATGATLATVYLLFLNHKQVVYFLGTIACVLYLFEQIRISYPEYSDRLQSINNLFLRAEERLKESATVPYAMGVLLAILTFPKAAAIIAIYTLAIADPFSAIVGIRFGRHKISGSKTLEGSIAYYCSSFLCAFLVLSVSYAGPLLPILVASFLISILGTIFELTPLKIDDNLTIPLFTGAIAAIIIAMMGLDVLPLIHDVSAHLPPLPGQ